MTALRKTEDLTAVENHFAFGQNWSSYAEGIAKADIEKAVESLSRLIPPQDMNGKNFLDIGCGSGLSMLAALHLDAATVSGVDIDTDSAKTAARVLNRAGAVSWTVDCKSVFDLDPAHEGVFDIVHSWGVLHHTGDMERAVRKAAALVAPGGLFVLALYSRTPLCGFWRQEKRIYSKASKGLQKSIRAVYKVAYLGGIMATGRHPASYLKTYNSNRGMDWHHDVHDWLGGYPYESVTPDAARSLMAGAGFEPVRAFTKQARAFGLFGSHCDEYVFRKVS